MTDISWTDDLIAAARSKGPNPAGADKVLVDVRGQILWVVGDISVVSFGPEIDDEAVIVLEMGGAVVGQPCPTEEELHRQVIHMPLSAFAYLTTGVDYILGIRDDGWPQRWAAAEAREVERRAARLAAGTEPAPDVP